MNSSLAYNQVVRTPLWIGAVFLAAVLAFVSGGGRALASDITPERVTELTNESRSEAGLPALETDEALTRAAEMKVADMAERQYFSHTSPKGIPPWHWIDRSGYRYLHAGENLAIRFADAESQSRAWMESPKHRENILSQKYRDTGVAVREATIDGETTLVVVQMFGTRVGESAPSIQGSVSGVSRKRLPAAAAAEEAPASVSAFRTGVQTAALFLQMSTALLAAFGLGRVFRGAGEAVGAFRARRRSA